MFKQSFPEGLEDTATPLPIDHAADTISSSFPAFKVEGDTGQKGFLSYAGNQIFASTALGEWSTIPQHIPAGKEV